MLMIPLIYAFPRAGAQRMATGSDGSTGDWMDPAYPEMTGLSSDVMSDGVQARKVHFLDFDPTRVSVLSMCPPGHV